MAIYPLAHRIHRTSTEREIDVAKLSVALGGVTRMRRSGSRLRREFTIVHHGLSLSEKNALSAFLNAERRKTISLLWPSLPGRWVSVMWIDSEIEWSDEGACKWHTKLMMREAT
jgi:hypothetical protein